MSGHVLIYSRFRGRRKLIVSSGFSTEAIIIPTSTVSLGCWKRLQKGVFISQHDYRKEYLSVNTTTTGRSIYQSTRLQEGVIISQNDYRKTRLQEGVIISQHDYRKEYLSVNTTTGRRNYQSTRLQEGVIISQHDAMIFS